MKLQRVPTVDQCYTEGDPVCWYEADQQFKRDKQVDSMIIKILRYRIDDCLREEYPDYERCLPMKETYEEAAAAWFAKCQFINLAIYLYCQIISLKVGITLITNKYLWI